MSFPPLLWFWFAVLGVVLIHLINVFRHRRVAWGAMAFLLASHRVSRTRLFWERILLLLLRATAVAVIVLAFAGPLFPDRLAEWFGGGATEHLILLDDSFSMSERSLGGATPWDQALAAVETIIERGREGDTLTLLRTSRSNHCDLDRLSIGEARRALAGLTLSCSESAATLESAMASVSRLLDERPSRVVVSILSDFRSRESEAALAEPLATWARKGVRGRLVACRIADERPNLVVSEVRLLDGVHAAGIEMGLDLRVTNSGRATSEAATLTVSVAGIVQPSLTIPPLSVGESTAVRASIRVAQGGGHAVVCELPSDSVAADNRRPFVLRVPDAVGVLIVTSSETIRGAAATSLRLALAPRGTVSGIAVQTEPLAFLSGDATLDPFAVVIIPETPSLTSVAVRRLEEFVARGGGLVFFASDQTDPARVNAELHRNGHGLFPLPLGELRTLPPDYLGRLPDLRPISHPMFRLFHGGEDDALLAAIQIDRYFATSPIPAGRGNSETVWETLPKTVRIVATLRNGDPLVAERTWGDGRVVAVLTTADAAWNSWGRTPSFVVVMQDLIASLAERRSPLASSWVGEPITLAADTALGTTATLSPLENSATVPLQIVEVGTPFELEQSGFYTATRVSLRGTPEAQLLAVAADPREGEMRWGDATAWDSMTRRVDGRMGTWVQQAAFTSGVWGNEFIATTAPRSDTLLLWVIACCLVGEMLLARRMQR